MKEEPIRLNNFETKLLFKALEKCRLTCKPNENIYIKIRQTKKNGVITSQFHNIEYNRK
jgi:hypothetical protein